MNKVIANSNPYVIAPSGDPANFAESELCVIASGAGTIVLPLISTLRAGSMDIYIQASGGTVTINAGSGNNIIGADLTGAPTVTLGNVKTATPVGLTTWFVR